MYVNDCPSGPVGRAKDFESVEELPPIYDFSLIWEDYNLQDVFHVERMQLKWLWNVWLCEVVKGKGLY